MAGEHTEPVPTPDPGNAPPELWVGEPVDPDVEKAMLDAALATDQTDVAYEVAVDDGV